MKCNHCNKDIPTAQAIKAVQKYLKTFPPDIVPQATAARAIGCTRQNISNQIRKGKIQTIEIYGEKWVSISDLPAKK